MKNSKESRDLTRQNEKNVQKSQKHDANLQKNSSLYFQIGLIMCLLAAYGALEMRFQSNDYIIPLTAYVDSENDAMFAPSVLVEPDAIETSEPVKTKPVHIIKPEIIDNDTPDKKETDKLITEIVKPTKPKGNVTVDLGALDPPKVDPDIELPFEKVEVMPIFPGCESATTNDERRKCMSDNLTKIVKRRFDAGLGAELGLKEGVQKIYIQFRINKLGEAELVQTRAPHQRLEKEAEKVVSKVPQMTPGLQGGKPVSVLYTLPIAFQVKY